MKKILILHGPNINLTGWREPEIYGDTTFSEIENNIVKLGKELGFYCENFQSNHEGELIDKIHGARGLFDGIIINPGAYTHYSYAIHDALVAVEIDTIEVHMSNIFDRESFREKSVTAPACVGTVCGFAENSYYLALYAMQRLLED
ncbi:MAG: type II 3-dehydroquinate dehydratase [Oscillospiraceae bacterium]|jgi:3-dehydroquinate dehydratase-2|nr:type II 3-dehydroquinate dehydratase [Oscillospiraceae bacterium]